MEQDIRTIDVYVELDGKQNYHSSLKGREENDQHPISAITNLQETLNSFDSKVNNLEDNITTNNEEISKKVDSLESKIEANNEEQKNELESVKSDLDNKINSNRIESNKNDDLLDKKITTTRSELIKVIDDKTLNNLIYKGSVYTVEVLPKTNNKTGDVYRIESNGRHYVWNGEEWLDLSPIICLKDYATKDYVDTAILESTNIFNTHLINNYYNKEQIDTIIDKIIIDENSLKYKGVVSDVSQLPTENQRIGDTYSINNSQYFWNGTNWIRLGGEEPYTKQEIDELDYYNVKWNLDTENNKEVVLDNNTTLRYKNTSDTKIDIISLKEDIIIGDQQLNTKINTKDIVNINNDICITDANLGKSLVSGDNIQIQIGDKSEKGFITYKINSDLTNYPTKEDLDEAMQKAGVTWASIEEKLDNERR